MIKVGNKGIADILVGNRAVAAIYRGATLVWQKIQKIIDGLGWCDGYCIEYIPSNDITLNSVSILVQDWNEESNHKLRILNECGICIAYSSSNGIELHKEIYTYVGALHTVSSLGSITLYKNQKYYINYQKSNGGENLAHYKDLTHNYKSFSNIANINSVYSADAYSHKCDGEASSFEDICQKTSNCYFIWRGNAFENSMVPSEAGSGNPYPYLLKRDMSRVKKIFTDTDFNSYNNDIERYAYIFYTMGTTEGDEFIMQASNWVNGFDIDPTDEQHTKYFTNNFHKIYKITGNMIHNHITSMTPMDDAPTNPDTFGIYYKSATNSWGNISQKAVVAWTGSNWEIAKSWASEWTADTNYDATNYCEKINDSYAKDFNLITVSNGTKYYFKVNDTEV